MVMMVRAWQAYLSFFDHLEALPEDEVFAKSVRVQPMADSSHKVKYKLRQSCEEGEPLSCSLARSTSDMSAHAPHIVA
jgi:hypothetical protein